MTFTKTQKIGASMVGSGAKLSAIGTFQIVQDAVTDFMGELKIDGITVKRKFNAFWVFVKTRVKFFKTLAWSEECTVTAFISSMSLAKMCVDVKVSGSDKSTAFYARVELCVLDISTQRIIKLSAVGVEKSMLSDETALDIIYGKFDEIDVPLFEKVKVRSTNIDHSHHTNNLEYLRFIMNTYSVEEIEKRVMKEMEVVYASQSYENDELDVLKIQKTDRDFIVLQKDNKPVIKCEIVFN